MRTFGLALAAAATAGFLLGTEKGRKLTQTAGEKLREGCESLQQRFGASSEVERTVEDALAEPHPDTQVARAFEAAVS